MGKCWILCLLVLSCHLGGKIGFCFMTRSLYKLLLMQNVKDWIWWPRDVTWEFLASACGLIWLNYICFLSPFLYFVQMPKSSAFVYKLIFVPLFFWEGECMCIWSAHFCIQDQQSKAHVVCILYIMYRDLWFGILICKYFNGVWTWNLNINIRSRLLC